MDFSWIYIISIGICAIVSFKAGQQSKSFEISELIQETIDWLIEEGFVKYDEKKDELIKYNED